MKETKFRAWDKINNKMWDPVIYINFVLKKVGIAVSDTKKYCEMDLKDVELLQYVGLKDKNDAEQIIQAITTACSEKHKITCNMYIIKIKRSNMKKGLDIENKCCLWIRVPVRARRLWSFPLLSCLHRSTGIFLSVFGGNDGI